MENTIKKNKPRIEWIDFARGIGILLVLIGHTKIPYLPRYLAYAFHMPFFFIISGLCFSVKKEENFWAFLLKKTRTLIVPYFFISFLWFIYDCVREHFHSQITLKFIVEDVSVYLVQRHFHAIWFLTCLFLCEIFMFFIARISNRKILITITIVFFILSFLYSEYVNLILPWCIDLVLTALPFMLIGYIWKKAIIGFEITKKNLYLPILLLIICIAANAINVIIFNNGNKTNFMDNDFAFYPLYLISSIAGSFSLIFFAKWFKYNKLINYIGANSILFFTVHQIIFSTADNLKDITGDRGMAFDIIMWIVYFILSIVVITIMNEIMIRTPLCVLIGKKYKKA